MRLHINLACINFAHAAYAHAHAHTYTDACSQAHLRMCVYTHTSWVYGV